MNKIWATVEIGHIVKFLLTFIHSQWIHDGIQCNRTGTFPLKLRMWINAATGRAGPHKHPTSEWSRTGSFHQRALYSVGRDPRYADTRLQCASGEIFQQVTQKAKSRQQSQRKALNRTPKAGGVGHLAAGSSDLEVFEGAWGGAERRFTPAGAPCQGAPAV